MIMASHGENRKSRYRNTTLRDAPQLGGDRGRITGAEPRLSLNAILPQALDLLRQPESRDQAVTALLRLGDAAVPALLDLLHDPDPPVRHAAAWAVGRLRDRSSARALIRAAEWTTPYAHAQGDPAASGALIRALRVGSRPTRVMVMVALGRLGDRRAIPDLLEQIGGDYLLGRLAAIWALGRIGGSETIPHLADALDDPDPLLRSCAAAAIEAVQGSRQPESTPDLQQVDPNSTERITLGES
jgi:HEAT repeat protein